MLQPVLVFITQGLVIDGVVGYLMSEWSEASGAEHQEEQINPETNVDQPKADPGCYFYIRWLHLTIYLVVFDFHERQPLTITPALLHITL